MEEFLIDSSIFLYVLNVHYYNKIALRNKEVNAKTWQEIVKMPKCVIILIEVSKNLDGGIPVVYYQQGLS